MKLKKISLGLFSMCLMVNLTGCIGSSSKDEVLNYLENKYNEKFVIENYTNSNKLINQYGGDYGIAHPVSNKNIAFNIGTVGSKEGGCYDNYNLAKWSYELDSEINEMVKRNLGNNVDSKVFIYSSSEQEYENISAKEYLNLENDNARLSLDLGIEINNPSEIENYYDGIYNVFEDLKLYNTKKYNITVGFVDDINDIKNQEYLRLAGPSNIIWENVDSKVYAQMRITYVDDIQNVDDIKKLLEKF